MVDCSATWRKVNPLTAFHYFRYFILRTNSIFMCPNAVLLSEHHYDIYVIASQIVIDFVKFTNILSFWFHTVQLFLILYSVLTGPIRAYLIMHFGNEFWLYFLYDQCNDNTQQRHSCSKIQMHWKMSYPILCIF